MGQLGREGRDIGLSTVANGLTRIIGVIYSQHGTSEI